jgi:hypothetical protein
MNVRSMKNTRFSGLEMLKGLETRTRSGSKVPSRLSPHLVAPSGLIRVGELPRVNPGLRSLGHFGPRVGRMTRAKHIQAANSGLIASVIRPGLYRPSPVRWCSGCMARRDCTRDSSDRPSGRRGTSATPSLQGLNCRRPSA